MAPYPSSPPPAPQPTSFDLILKHGHPDLVQCIAFNAYGDRSATGSVDGRVRVFNRARDGVWRFCDVWAAHPAEVLDLQWLPPTIHPNLIASLGVEGRFKLWAEDPGAVAGRRFANTDATPKAAFETRSARSVYRSFSMRHNDETRHTYLALLAADGHLTVFENEQVENLSDYNNLDDWNVFGGRPARGEETSFRVRFDPNPEVCYTALRAGVPTDALGLVVAAMDRVLVYRTRDTVTSQMGIATSVKEFYLAAELPGHKGLVRDVAWAPGNIRGYDVIATACQDGFVRVFKLETPINPSFESGETNGRGWSSSVLRRHAKRASADEDARTSADASHPQSGIKAGLDRSRSSADRRSGGQPGQIKHVVKEISKLDSHRTPVWRVGFDDDGQILGSVGDDGKLMCYRQTPDGTWAKSAELAMMKMKMAVPDR
ncbi:WD domain-containing protein [Coniochaeta ligniaria NRRL 30616]|uniref:WD domain-containing protein n=1 Tax=Coniochaeta ligniaria NRRL 30616 TaxID=1408157 RepID=A0A1J7IYH2_9PEZI|nr:WD domain-containing protein [Coniochaeta ligniaria NRRL 30616]